MRSNGVAIVGIGDAGISRSLHGNMSGLVDTAVSSALEDAGMRREELDGLVVHIGSPRGLDYDEVANLLALDTQYSNQGWSHGRFGATTIINAVMALECGLANAVVCVGAFKNSTFATIGSSKNLFFSEGSREGGGPHGEWPFLGMVAPIAGAAMSTRRYLYRYGIDRERLGAVAIAQRQWSHLNQAAVMRGRPMDRAAYKASPPIVEPLRRFDCSVPVDVACAIILTRADRAEDVSINPVHVLSYQGLQAGPGVPIFGQPGDGINQPGVHSSPASVRPIRVFDQVYMTTDDIDAFYCYDGFSVQIPWTLERFGYCSAGQGLDFIEDRLGPEGSFPVNTHGGHLSEGHTNGWGATLEIVRQLRGEAGPRQVSGIGTAQWATTLGDSILYSNQPAS